MRKLADLKVTKQVWFVGSFGESQVMDWGLAKLLTRSDIADETQFRTAQLESAPSFGNDDTVLFHSIGPVSSGGAGASSTTVTASTTGGAPW